MYPLPGSISRTTTAVVIKMGGREQVHLTVSNPEIGRTDTLPTISDLQNNACGGELTVVKLCCSFSESLFD